MTSTFSSPRIVFFGTPAFAATSLQALHEAGFEIVAVVTAPDRPAGRGLKSTFSAVKDYALAQNMHLLQPERLKAPEFLAALQELHADLGVVVAFRMLPEVVWDMPPLGTINVHGSLLPNYRGAAPIQWAIMNGEVETGVTTFRLKHEIDTGNLLLQQKIKILDTDTTGSLTNKMMLEGAHLLVQTVKGLQGGALIERPQDQIAGVEWKHARKIVKEDGHLDFGQPMEHIYNTIRGLNPQPGAYTYVRDKMLKVHLAHYEHDDNVPTPSTLSTDGKTFLRIAAINGWIYLDEVQLQGKKRLAISEFLKGFHV